MSAPDQERERLLRLVEDMMEVGRRLYERGLVAGCEGNISIRIDDGSLLTTASGVCKGKLHPDMILRVAIDGSVLPLPGEAANANRYRPSTELDMHLAVYRNTRAGAAVHAHPVHATAYALAEVPFPERAMPETITFVGPVARVPYAPPGSRKLADAFAPFWKGHRAFLMAQHGVLTIGTDVFEALHRLESLERCAQIVCTAAGMGSVNTLTADQIRELGHGSAGRGTS